MSDKHNFTGVEKGYNGWTNYETWNLALWIDNEQGPQEYWHAMAQDCYRLARSSVSPTFTRREQATLDLCHMLKDEIEEGLPEVTGFYADVLNAAISEVNWYEIAEHWIDEIVGSEDDDAEDEAVLA